MAFLISCEGCDAAERIPENSRAIPLPSGWHRVTIMTNAAPEGIVSYDLCPQCAGPVNSFIANREWLPPNGPPLIGLTAVRNLANDLILKNPDKAAQARARPLLAGWFVGQIMKATAGRADPDFVLDLVQTALSGDRDDKVVSLRGDDR